MEPLPEKDAELSNSSENIHPSSLGGMLREAREKLGLSVADVAGQIKFAPRQIEALEANDFKNLPETAFLRGFVRSYVKILHLDVQPFLDAMPQAKSVVAESIPASVNVPFPYEHLPQRKNLILFGSALFLAVVVVFFAVWHFTNPVQQNNVTKIATPVSAPEPIMQDAPAPLPVETPAISEQTVPQPVEPLPAVVQVPVEPKALVTVEPKILVTVEPKAQVAVEPKPPVPVKAVAVPPQVQPPIAASHIEPKRDAHKKTTSLRLVFDVESWSEIREKDGKVLSSQVNPRGSELILEGRMPILLVIGHAALVHLYQDGVQVDLAPHINSSSEVARLTLE